MLSPVSVIYASIIEGDRRATIASVQKALEAGIDPEVILNRGMMAAMCEVGRLYEAGEYYIPEMLISARALKTGLPLLRPYLVSPREGSVGKVIIGTIKGDLHDIGKNLVAVMLEGAGFEVQDLGTDVPPEKFVSAVQAGPPDIVALSALLTTTMPYIEATIQALKSAGVRDQVKVMIGGVPVTETYAWQVGADGYSPDAIQAVVLAKALIAQERIGWETSN